jgi:hypothetical protein
MYFYLYRPTVERLLLVADPQLIGEKDEGFFGLITRIDADRYENLSKLNQILICCYLDIYQKHFLKQINM